MKTKMTTVDLSRTRKFLQRVGIFSQTFTTIMLGTLLFFVILNLASYAQTKLNDTPIAGMRGMAASVSSNLFLKMVSFEVPHLAHPQATSLLSQGNLFRFLFRFVTNINPLDPKTLLAQEVPNLANDSAVLLQKGEGAVVAAPPEDYMPAKKSIAAANPPKPTADGTMKPSALSSQPGAQSTPTPNASAIVAPTTSPSSAGNDAAPNKKVVLIYHTHNRESWVPELNINDPAQAYDSKTNITLVGKELAAKLNDLGIGAVDYSPDYPTTIKNFNYNLSYQYSSKTVKEAFAANPHLQFEFDIHRDSSVRSQTTLTVKGVNYAQVFFIIGEKNPNWQKNEQFATQIDQAMDKILPGISRGVWGKTANEGNAEYNQSVSPDSVLIEIGGPYNTLEECDRTVDLLAQAIAGLYWQSTDAVSVSTK